MSTSEFAKNTVSHKTVVLTLHWLRDGSTWMGMGLPFNPNCK